MSNKKNSSGQVTKHKSVNLNVNADYTNKSEDWYEQYGYLELNVNATKGNNVVGKSGMKIITQNNDLVVAMPESMTFIPHEVIDDLTEKEYLTKKLRELNPDLDKDFKIVKVTKRESHGGRTAHWVILTNIEKVIENSHEKVKDKIQLGLTVRNGYNTATSLGIDIFTYRLVCENGAFVRSKSLQKMSFAHVGKDPKKLFAEFATAFLKAVQDWDDVFRDYQKMTQIKLNQKMIEYIYERNSIVPDRLFPDYYQIADPTKVKKDQPLVTISAKGKTMTMWQDYNAFTKELWRSDQDQTYKKKNGKTGTHKGIAFSELAWRERRLHDSFVHILDNPEAFR